MSDKEPDWNKANGGSQQFGWGGLMAETSKQSVAPGKGWVGKKDGSVKSLPNG